MFTDWQEALDAEGLPLHPTSTEQEAAAARTAARNAHGKDDLSLLLGALGLPGDEDTLTTLIPLLPDPEGDPDMAHNLSAFEATAVSMHAAGHSTAQITEATGLSADEITALLHPQQREDEAALDEAGQPPATQTTTEAATAGPVEELLTWADQHPAAGIRNKAARVRSDLAELTARRASDDAQREAERRVADLEAELGRAREQLQAAKTGSRRTSPPATSTATPIGSARGSGRSREELAAVRSWARANGHQVADAGKPRASVLEAYDAAMQAPVAKAG